MALLYSRIPFGWTWAEAENELDRDLLRRALESQPLSLKSILTSTMAVHAEMRGKQGVGAKFPVHYSYVDKLLEWFPECLLLHTTRDPKAVYASQAVKYLRADQHPLARAFERLRQFAHINVQITWTAHVHKKLKDLPRYRVVHYEDVVREPAGQLKEICEFLGVQYLPEMTNPHQYGSSFEAIGGKSGVEKSSLERWRSTISPVTAASIDLLHPRAARVFARTE